MSGGAPSRRLVFGVDRLPEHERTTKAWPSQNALESRQQSAYQRAIHPAKWNPAPDSDRKVAAERDRRVNGLLRQAKPDLRALQRDEMPGWHWTPREDDAEAPA